MKLVTHCVIMGEINYFANDREIAILMVEMSYIYSLIRANQTKGPPKGSGSDKTVEAT